MRMQTILPNLLGNSLLRYSLMLLTAVPMLAMAQPLPMQEGKQFASIAPPLATQAPADVIEVLDVFWYGCPICREFEPMTTYYGGEIRGDLVMRRMPAIWNAAMKVHAQLYYTAVELGMDRQVHSQVFAYLQEAKQPLNTQEQIRAFFVSQGASAEDFDQAWNSDKVAAAVQMAEQDTAAADIARLPALIVNGRYRVVRNASIQELPELVIMTNQLIRSLRDERRVD